MGLATSVARAPRARRSRHQLGAYGWGLTALAAGLAAGAMGASAGASHPELVASARALLVGVPTAVGLYAWYHDRSDRFALLLVATGAGGFLATLSELDDELLYTLGRTAGWLVEVLLVYLILSFPTGRLPDRIDRVLVGAMAGVVLTLFIPRLALAEDFPVPNPFTSCVDGCPSNAFFLLEREPALVDAFLRPAGTLLTIAVLVAVLLRLRERIGDATPLARRMYTPVLVVGVARVALLAVGFIARDLERTAWPVQAVAWSLALAVPALALAFLVGIVRWRLFSAEALGHLAQWLGARHDAETMRRALAKAFDDREIQIVFPADGAADRWTDSAGRPVTMPEAGSGRTFTEVRERGTVLAAVVHDETLAGNPTLLDAGVAIAGIVLANQRLASEADTATREIRSSRARITASAERERRRIERDLHDGAQQRLVSLRIELELAEELVRSDPEQGIERLRELERHVDEALDEIRALAHGVYPPLLADLGLVDALETAASRSAVRVEVQARGVERYPPEVESAVYFCVLEALQNILKHAVGVHQVVLRLEGRHGELRFSVRDDGAGVSEDAIQPGAGITNMCDRLMAVGGRVEISSRPGVGTTVRGLVPTPPGNPL